MLNSDLPIQEKEDDLLGRRSVAESLAQVIYSHSTEEGFVIGMYGKWGSGKTSFLNMVISQVRHFSTDDSDKPIILNFNPWLCSDPSQLIIQFFKQLSSVIKKEKPKLKKIYKVMDDYAEAFELAGAILPKVGPILSAIGKYKKYKATKRNNDLQGLKSEISSHLRGERVKLIVTIDDIDRLSNNEIISVFQLVKSLADFPYTIYLLSFDREVVIRALQDVQSGDGEEYLQKIVQVPFDLPIPFSDDIHSIFLSKLEAIVKDYPEDKWDNDYWRDLFHFGLKHFLKSIRDSIRFCNTFSLKYALLKDETNVIDLIGVTCLQVFEPDVYSKLPFYHDILCGGFSRYSNYNQEEKEKEKIQRAYEAIIDGVSYEHMERIKVVLQLLFPKLNALTNYSSYNTRQYNGRKAIVEYFISNPACFHRYFLLSIEPSAISNSTIEYLLFSANQTDILEGIEKINSSGKTTKLLEYIEASFYLDKNQPDHSDRAKILLTCLTRSWDKLEDNEEQSFFSIPFDWRLLYCTTALVNVIDKADRFNIISSLFIDPEVSLSTLARILLDFERQHNRFTDNELDVNKAQLSLDEVFELERTYTKRVLNELESGELIKKDSLLHILWVADQLNENEIKKLSASMIKTEQDLAYFISSAVSRGKGADKTVFTIWNVDKDSINEYIDIDEAYHRIDKFVYTNEFMALDNKRQEDIVAFLLLVEKNVVESSAFRGVVIQDINRKLEQIKCKSNE